MATAQKITKANRASLMLRSDNPRGSSPNGNYYLDTANDKVQLISAEELPQITYPVGHAGYSGGAPEANPLTNGFKIQIRALYFEILAAVQADPALQNFRFSVDTVSNEMTKLVGASAFLNGITLDTNTSTTNSHDRDKIADSGMTEFQAGGGGNTIIDRVYHGVKSQNPINATSQAFYMLAASLSEADRQAATPINFASPGDVNEVINTYINGGTDNRKSALIIGVRDFGYTTEETNSISADVAELGAYSQGYGIGNKIVPEIAALTESDVFGGAAVAPYVNLSFFRHAAPQTRTGFATTGAGASGDFTDEIQLSTGAVTIIQLRAWLDKLMQQDTDQNANTGVTGPFLPKRAEPFYTIDPANGKLVTRSGLYIDPAKLTAEAQQQIVMTADGGGQHFIPFNSGIAITVSDVWLNDPAPWFRLMYSDGAASADFDTSGAVTVKDASAVDIAGNALDSRISGNTLSIAYAYDTNTQAGLPAGADKVVVLQIGGIDTSKSRTVTFTITASASIAVDASTEAETN